MENDSRCSMRIDFNREKPFGLTIVLNANGDAEGDLFYDDGESIDTVRTKSYYYSTFKWSQSQRQLTIQVKENNYPKMSNLTLDSLTIYGLDIIPTTVNSGDKQYRPKTRPFTQIVEVTGLGLLMSEDHRITWSITGSSTAEIVEIPPMDPKYRVDCHPDSSKYQHSIEYQLILNTMRPIVDHFLLSNIDSYRTNQRISATFVLIHIILVF